MRAIRLSFFQMLAYMRQDMMLFAVCFAPIPAGIVFRFVIPSVVAFIVTVALLPVFKLTSLSVPDIILFAAGGTLQGIITALLVLTISSNKLEGMAVAKLSGLMMFGAVVPFFIKDALQYVLFILPSFWIGKAACENVLLYMLPAFFLSAVWIFVLLKRYLR